MDMFAVTERPSGEAYKLMQKWGNPCHCDGSWSSYTIKYEKLLNSLSAAFDTVDHNTWRTGPVHYL